MIPTFVDRDKTNVTYTIERIDGDMTVNVASKWQDPLFVGQNGLESGEYLVNSEYTT